MTSSSLFKVIQLRKRARILTQAMCLLPTFSHYAILLLCVCFNDGLYKNKNKQSKKNKALRLPIQHQ